MKRDDKPFFVGYLPIPKGLVALLLAVSVISIGTFAALAFAVGGTQDNPGDGRVRGDFGRQTVSGIVEVTPYPMLHVTTGSDQIAPGETLMLSGAGKFGVIQETAALAGSGAAVTGVILNRGTIRMLQIPNRQRDIKATDVDAPAPLAIDLGKWRLAGEICDGKCLTGAMRPGRGLAHKACAELCLLGGVPPVFVTGQPVEGFEFFMIGAADGGPMPDALMDRVGVYVSLEGRIEKRGGLAVFLVDPKSMEVLP